MRPWLVAALLLLLAVPHLAFWPDYETARRGLLALCCGLLCLFPGSLPRRVPITVWAINVLALWLLVRSLSVTHHGYALENATHFVALAVLMLVGTGTSLAAVLLAAIPTGLVVALVTLCQAFGWLLPLPNDLTPTATLGNLNVASEVLTVCGAAAACVFAAAALPDEEPRFGIPGLGGQLRILALATVVMCAAAVWVNGSLSGLCALPLGCLPVLFTARRLGVILALVGGLGLGMAVDMGRVMPAETRVSAQASDAQSPEAPSTTRVRLALWRAGLKMSGDHPWVGHGPGQFQIQYPRYRSQEELELSTFHRSFLAAPGAIHNDFLQLLIEGGIPALLLLLVAVWLLLRRAPFQLWGPLLAFAFLAGVRAPLGNAPAVALVFLFGGALLGQFPRRNEKTISFAPRRQLIKGLVFGGLLLVFGAAQLLAQIAGAGMLERRAAERDPQGQLACVQTALAFRPWDHHFRQLHAKAQMLLNNLTVARADIEELRRIHPYDSLVNWRWIELLRAEGKLQDAIKELQKRRAADPHDTTATLWTTEILVQLRLSPQAIVILYKNPPFRDQLAKILDGFAEFADKRGDLADAAILRMEQSFISVLDHMIAGRHVAAQTHWRRFQKQQIEIDTEQRDPRWRILAAAQAMALGDRKTAESYAGLIGNRPLAKTHAALMEPVIASLRDLPAWRAILNVPGPKPPP